MHDRRIPVGEKGSAYLMIFLIMTVILVLGSSAYFAARVEMFGMAWKKRELIAEYAAEAGISEVLLRLNLPDDPALLIGSGGSGAVVDGCAFNACIGENPLNPAFPDPAWNVTLLFASCAALPPSSPPDYFTKSLQANPPEVLYTTDIPAEETLVVTYLRDIQDVDADGDEAELVFYDPRFPVDGLDNGNAVIFGADGIMDNESAFNLQAAGMSPSGFPALRVRCTGREGQGRVTLETVAVKKAFVRPLMEAAVTAGGTLSGTGLIFISGFNHGYDTDATGWGSTCHRSYYGDGLDNNGDGSDDPLEIDFDWDCFHAATGHRAGSGSNTINLPAGSLIGSPWMNTGGSGILDAWSYLGIDQAAWDEMAGQRGTDQYPGDGSDGVYIIGQSSATISVSGSGSGLIYTPGSLELTSDFTFKGFIYAEENITAAGSPWVCGAVVAGGTVTITGDNPSVPAALLFCDEAIRKLTRFIPYRTVGRTYQERF